MQSLVPFLLFAVVASITPGPTNILVLSNSQRHGLAAAWPIVLGACAAVAALILLLGLGLGELLRRHPLLQQGLAWLGVGWLSYLAWSLFRSAGGIDGTEPPRRLGVFGGAALQLVNPKAWMMALAALALFAGEGPDRPGGSACWHCCSSWFRCRAWPVGPCSASAARGRCARRR